MSDINQKNIDKMMEEYPKLVKSNAAGCINLFSSIKWKKVTFTIGMAPKPSQRPRLCGYRVYVPGAAKNASFFNKNVLPNLHGLFITTPCKLKLDIYVETPKSFTKTQKLLAEMKILRPWGSTGDIDNYDKSLLDQIQPNEKRGHTGILEDDCLVIESHSNKYYSCTPRYEVTLTYMVSVPKSIVSVLRLNRSDDKDVV